MNSPLSTVPPGLLTVTSGTLYTGDSATPIGLIDAEASLSLTLSEQIFGPDIASRQSSALIVLRNLGADLIIGGGQPLANAISEPLVTGLGGMETSGLTRSVTLLGVPEPGTLALTVILVLAFGALLCRRARGSTCSRT